VTAVIPNKQFMKKKFPPTIRKVLLFPIVLFYLSVATFAQQAVNNIHLSGRVVDSKDKNGLGGATVHIKGTTHRVSTNEKGEFKFVTGQKVPVTYVVSLIGYKTREILVNQALDAVIDLSEVSSQLNDVVVIGYGTQKRSDLSGAVASVPKNLLNQPVASFDNLLQGAVAGVTVTQSSGQPGATASIRVRGGNSLSFGNDPLYVIDGFIYYNDNGAANLRAGSGSSVTGAASNALSTINPNDIESIEILKDAAATAIYGSRGANGVVLITTKRGTKGSNNISYSNFVGAQQATKTVDVLNGQQWAKYFGDLYAATPSIQSGLAPAKKIIDSLGNAGVSQNWTDEAIKSNIQQNHQISIHGGDEKSRYAIAGNYFQQKGIVIGTDFRRYTARVNYEKNVSDKLKVATVLFGSNTLSNKNTGSAFNDINFSNAFSSLYLANPLQLAKNNDGSYRTTFFPQLNSTTNTINGVQYTDNPIQNIASTTNQSVINRFLGNASLDYKFKDGLVFKSTIGVDNLITKLNYFAPSYTAQGNNGGTTTGTGSVGNINTLSWLNENTLNYDFDIRKEHFFNLLAGYTTQYTKTENTFVYGQSFPTDALTYNNLLLATQNKVTATGEAQEQRNSWLARVNYSFNHKYNFSGSLRADGASPLGQGKKWGLFPAFGFSWNISQEEFLKKYSNTVSNAKLRLTAGSGGNSNIPAYSSLATINSNGYYLGSSSSAINGLSPTQPINPELTWETTTQYNAGLDVGLLKNRVNITADIYYKKTTNLFISGSGLIPLSTGYSSVAKNIGSLENKGIELALNTENIRKKDFSWKSTIIFSTNSSKILSLGPSQQFFPIAPTGQVSPVVVKVGLPVGTFWGYKTDGLLTTADAYGPNQAPKLTGVSQVTGDRKYLHAPGVTGANITTADKQNLGSAQPKFTFSVTNNFAYKNFDLSFFIQGSVGNKIFNLLQQQLERTTTTQNVTALVLDRWDSIANPTGKFQKVTNAPVMQVQDTYIEDGSYVRLKNITVGYNFPKNWASKLHAKQLRLYVSAQNLITLTKYTGQDPEVNFYDQNNLQPGIDLGIYPRYRTFLAGLNVTF
jgi:TonB-dependent starch-binding outer membrane protein SusC